MRAVRPKRSPFGWAVAVLRREPKRARELCFRLLGQTLGGRLWRAARVALLREGKLRRDSERTDPVVMARFVAVALRILDHTSPSRGRAMSRRLGQAYVALQESISQRQLQRYLRCLRRAQVLRTHQPPAHAMPAHLRWGEWAFCAYDWQGELPRETHTVLARWRGRAAPLPALSG